MMSHSHYFQHVWGFQKVLDALRIRIARLRPRPSWEGEGPRLPYQEQYISFPIRPGDRVLDVGSGGYPFPLATAHIDKYPTELVSRREPLAPVIKPFVAGDLQELPFTDKSFDFVYASHVLQSVHDPLRACAEMMRVGRAGFIEVPTFGNTALFSWAKGLMKWHAVAINQHLCFFEYTERQLEGIRSTIWRDQILSRWHEPLQDVFYPNRDIFNVLFPWKDSFSVFAFGCDGSTRTLTRSVGTQAAPPCPPPSQRMPVPVKDDANETADIALVWASRALRLRARPAAD